MWDEFTLVAQQPEFIKLLMGGEPLVLPIKGSNIRKTDNPLIMTSANHSIKELVLRK